MSVKTDNTILDFIKKSNQDNREVYVEPKLPKVRSDVYLNWTKQSSVNPMTKIENLFKEAKKYKDLGFFESDTQDVLISEGSSVGDVKRITNEVYAQVKNEIPEKYDDLKDHLESLVLSMSPKEFLKLATNDHTYKNSLIVFSSKDEEANFEEILRYVDYRKNEPTAINAFHKAMSPHVDREIQKSYLLAEVKYPVIKISRTERKNVFAVRDDKELVGVDSKNRVCTCSRYVEGNFRTFEIPCEHIISTLQSTDREHVIKNMQKNILASLNETEE